MCSYVMLPLLKRLLQAVRQEFARNTAISHPRTIPVLATGGIDEVVKI